MNIRKTKYVIGGAVISLGVGIIVATSLPKSFQYYVTVDELRARQRELSSKELKVAGKVTTGSVQKSSGELFIRFDVENASQKLPVEYRGAVPDTFKEGADVVVTGRLSKNGTLVATDVLAKCASRYQEKMNNTLEAKPRTEN